MTDEAAKITAVLYNEQPILTLMEERDQFSAVELIDAKCFSQLSKKTTATQLAMEKRSDTWKQAREPDA